jgi:hydrogenase maturation protease
VTMVEIGTAILHGLSFLESAARVLVIDAARGGQPPGTIYLFDAGEAGAPHPGSSLHALGLREAARLLLRPGSCPPITVLGVEPASLDYGLELSGPVRAALPRVVALARQTVAGWGQARPRETAHPIAA